MAYKIRDAASEKYIARGRSLVLAVRDLIWGKPKDKLFISKTGSIFGSEIFDSDLSGCLMFMINKYNAELVEINGEIEKIVPIEEILAKIKEKREE